MLSCKPFHISVLAPGEEEYGGSLFSEELAAGALDRMMGCDAPRPRNGVVWTRLRGAALGEDDDAIAPKLGPRAIA